MLISNFQGGLKELGAEIGVVRSQTEATMAISRAVADRVGLALSSDEEEEDEGDEDEEDEDPVPPGGGVTRLIEESESDEG